MKQKIVIYLLILSILWSFIALSLTRNIYIKFNEYEFVSYLFDTDRQNNFITLLHQDIESKKKSKIKIILWRDFVFEDSLENLGITVSPINTEKFNLTLSNTYEFLKNFYLSDDWYLISVEYSLLINKDTLTKKILEKIQTLKEEDYKKYFIKNYTFDKTYWLVWIEDSFPNIRVNTTNLSNNSQENKYSLVVDTTKIQDTISISKWDFTDLEIKVPTTNNWDLFEEKYQSLLQNYKTNITLTLWDQNYNSIFWKDYSIIQELDKDTLVKYLEISNSLNQFFTLKSEVIDHFLKKLQSIVSLDSHLLETYVTTLKNPELVNWKYKILLKKISLLDFQESLWKVKSSLVDDNLFQSQKYKINTTTEIKDKYYTYKTDYNITSKNLESDLLVCETLNWLMDWNNIKKRLEYNIITSNSFIDQKSLEEFIWKHEEELNNSLNIITQILLDQWLFVQNKEELDSTYARKWTSDSVYKNLPNSLNWWIFDYFSPRNKLEINSDTDFIWYCSYDPKTLLLSTSILSNKKLNSKIIFGPEKTKKVEKWTIEINWKKTTVNIPRE